MLTDLVLLCRLVQVNSVAVNSWGQWPRHAQKTAFHNAFPHYPSALKFFLVPLLRCSLSLAGGGSVINVPFRAEHSTAQLFCVVLYIANGFVTESLLLLNLKLNWHLLGMAGTQWFCLSCERVLLHICHSAGHQVSWRYIWKNSTATVKKGHCMVRKPSPEAVELLKENPTQPRAGYVPTSC